MIIDPKAIERIDKTFSEVGGSFEKMSNALEEAFGKAIKTIKENQSKPNKTAPSRSQ